MNGRWRLPPLVAAALAAGSDTRVEAVQLQLVAPSRQAMLDHGTIAVRLRNRERVRLSARLGRVVLVRSRVLAARRRARVVRLWLTPAGRAALEGCGDRLGRRVRHGRLTLTRRGSAARV